MEIMEDTAKEMLFYGALFIIVLTVVFLTFPRASALIMGTCEGFNFQTNILNYTISGNSSDTDGMNVTLFNNYINICFAPNYYPDSFTLTFYSDIIPVESTTYKPSFSGSGGCITNYTCSGWSDCSNGIQTRTCQKDAWKGIKDCYAKPVPLSQNCTNPVPTPTPVLNNTNSTISPAEKNPKENYLLDIIVVILAIVLVYYLVKWDKVKGGKRK